MNTYRTSKGERISQGIIDRNLRKAKEIKVRTFKNDNGFIRCEFTGQSSGTYLDTMHIISIDQCKKMGYSELIWDQRNLRFGTREYHKNFDNKPNQERVEIFEKLNNCKL